MVVVWYGRIIERVDKNMKKQIEQGIRKIADYYGVDYYGIVGQQDKTIEECAELIQAISKLKYEEYDMTIKNVIEEMADVQIMLKQMFYLLDCEKDVKKVMAYKVNRQLKRIGK